MLARIAPRCAECHLALVGPSAARNTSGEEPSPGRVSLVLSREWGNGSL